MRKKKSILFVRPDFHCSFFYRDAFRKQGWKADILVNPGYPKRLLYSNEDVLKPPGLRGTRFNLIRWLNHALMILWWLTKFWRYQFHLYYGRPPQFNMLENRMGLTRLFGEDFLIELWLSKLFGVTLLYLPTGCIDDDGKSTWGTFDSGNVCGNCGFFDRCDEKAQSLNFARIRRFFDFVVGFGVKNSREFIETHMRYKSIDLTLWHPNLTIPPEHQLPAKDNIRILHSAYLSNSGRNWRGRNIKGSPFVLVAIERLQAEGYPVEYLYLESKPSNQMRFYQAQADIVVEQLIYGWWGSTGVETMALGKPVVCYLRPAWKQFFLKNFPEYDSLPIVEADTGTIYDALKKLVTDADYRRRKGVESRRFAEAHFDPEKNTKALIQLLEAL